MAISLDEVRRRILVGLFSDDELMDSLVLKGGSALSLIYKVGSRSSIDMDFSVEEAFSNVDESKARMFTALTKEFDSIGYVLFDEKFEIKPRKSSEKLPEWWGGYVVQFKLAEKALFEKLGGDIEKVRRQSEVLGPAHKRTYTIDISLNEFCEGKAKREVDDYIVYVYSLEMIACEKLRAICQQMPEYKFGNKTARARDFYDIHQIISENAIDLTSEENLSILATVFAAKHVPLELLAKIEDSKNFHAPDWPAVEASLSGKYEPFDYYFNFVVDLASRIEASRKKQPPVA